ncbi:MAG: gliding motility-associated ABC transporter substrate-binding protein GldG [Paludibacteraceae bacterium]|nr:gliding motility-associated ABC transporter substrate-binding protein GldG [Paludibacteraceae bacterium]
MKFFSSKQNLWQLIPVAATLILCALLYVLHFRIDMTADKRYSLSEPTRQLLSNLTEPVEIDVYLSGDNLNPSFVRLQRAVGELLDEFAQQTPSSITYRFVTPHEEGSDEGSYQWLADRALMPVTIHESESGGSSRQVLVFPWAVMRMGERQKAFGLLHNTLGLSGEENINISIESLEHTASVALRQLLQGQAQRIAFIEGHGEYTELETYDVCQALSQYFYIDRGRIGADARILDSFAAIVIAGSRTPFTEQEKYVIDQYVMHGGRVLWLLDGVRFDMDALSESGLTPAIPLDVNLADLLFSYGVRITGAILQDEQSLDVPVNISLDPQQADFQPVPWYYAPILLVSGDHVVSRAVSPVMSQFASPIELVGNAEQLNVQYLLSGSNSCHLIPTPAQVDLQPFQATNDYFDLQYVPVGVLLEGRFQSAFAYRMRPDSIQGVTDQLNESEPARQAVIAASSIVRNDVQQDRPLPLGFDRLSRRQFGNRELLVNTMLWLVGNESWIDAHTRRLTLRLLNDRSVRTEGKLVQTICIGLPVLLLLLIGGVMWWKRH